MSIMEIYEKTKLLYLTYHPKYDTKKLAQDFSRKYEDNDRTLRDPIVAPPGWKVYDSNFEAATAKDEAEEQGKLETFPDILCWRSEVRDLESPFCGQWCSVIWDWRRRNPAKFLDSDFDKILWEYKNTGKLNLSADYKRYQ